MSELNFDIEKTVEVLKKTKLFDVNYYLMQNEDVRSSGVEPHYHYVVAGDREGRMPCRLFDPTWYKNTYGVDPNGVNLFVHYLGKGERLGNKPSPLFDPSYVVNTYSLAANESPLAYFLAKHHSDGVNPCAYFDTKEYLAIYPDIVNSTLPPFFHFIEYGIFEGRIPLKSFDWSYVRNAYSLEGHNLEVFKKFCAFAPVLNWKTGGRLQVERLQEEIKRNQQPGEFYEDKQVHVDPLCKADVDVFAFYLPQFHRDAKNDQWWGEGFTEWTNLSRGVPRYEGHYQPRVPANLGYYDLENAEVLRKQAAMAQAAGVDGFGIYYYDFGDKEVLRKPLQLLRESTDINIKYFLIWANETWSRRWDGSESDVLAAQEYPKGFEKKLARDISEYFDDGRYHTMDGRPFFVIYRPGHIPNSVAFIKKLRKEFSACGHDPLIYIAQSFGDLDPRPHGADGALEFPPHKLGQRAHLINGHKNLYKASHELRIYSYDEFVKISLEEAEPEYRLIKTAFPSWDNDARKQGSSSIMDGANPVKFQHWLRELIHKELLGRHKSRLVCINAWNEWGEGAYLEPDRHVGFANLNAVARAQTQEAHYRKKQLVLVGHDLFNGGAQRLLLEIGKRFKTLGVNVSYAIASKHRYSAPILEEYQKVGTVTFLSDVAESNDWGQFHEFIRGLHVDAYIFNTSVAAQWWQAFPDLGSAKTTALVHEMAGMLRLSCDAQNLASAAQQFTQVVFPANVVKDQFETFIGSAVASSLLIPQGIYKSPADLQPYPDNQANYRAFIGAGRDPIVVVGVGFADLRKGFDLFANTCAELVRRDIDVLFVWQGEIHVDFKRWLLADMEELIDNKNLLIVPTHENIGNIMEVADAYFLSSREDPFPSVALEAWTYGIPVYAFESAGGISDLIASDPALGTLLDGFSIVDAAEKLALLAQTRTEKRQQVLSAKEYRKTYVEQKHSFASYVDRLAQVSGIQSQVDVCVLTYNHAKYIEQRLKSIVEQTAQTSSVTVFDASSDDETADIVRKFRAENGCSIALQIEPKNKGYLPTLWRAALQKCSAEFVWFAEGDDLSHPYFLDRCLDILRKDEKLGLVFTGIQRIDGEGKPIDVCLQSYIESVMGPSWAAGGIFQGSDFLTAGALVANPITNISGVVWRREALAEVMKEFDNVKGVSFAFDWVAYAAVAKNGWKIAYIKELLNQHRMHEKSFSGELALEKHIEEIKRIYNCLDKIAKPTNVEKRQEYLDKLKAG